MNAKKMIEMLRSVESIEWDGHDVVVKFAGSEETFVSREFVRNSFTRDLLELFEDHLGDDEEDDAHG